MRSYILLVVARAILPVTVLFAVYMLLRGHNEPGGGFIAGLVTTSAIVLEALAFGVTHTQRRLGRILTAFLVIGLALALVAGLIAVAVGDPFLTNYHWHMPLPGDGYIHLSTTLIFDVGVYLTVIAATAVAIGIFADKEAAR
jgi:multisubunit Na+/H+ antiporter MnhB subunit